ncbi:MAG: diaminopimelate epimerase [Bradymonadia bacterium]|jgi:diaminopimelate epimerase
MPTPQQAPRSFQKWHGLGNDFIVVIDSEEPTWWANNARRLCDRHRGVGADGILLATSAPLTPAPLTTAPSTMRVINADGSEPEMCGNGLRCVAAALARRTGISELSVKTGAGVLAASVSGAEVCYDAGTVSFDPSPAGVSGTSAQLAAGGLVGHVASIGNPHWIFLNHPGADRLPELGPGLETDARFANRTNVEFVTSLSEDGTDWRVDVWERGVGITQACGTGATAVAAALVALGHAPVNTHLRIELPGGALEITVREDFRCNVKGPAVHVFDGTIGAF